MTTHPFGDRRTELLKEYELASDTFHNIDKTTKSGQIYLVYGTGAIALYSFVNLYPKYKGVFFMLIFLALIVIFAWFLYVIRLEMASNAVYKRIIELEKELDLKFNSYANRVKTSLPITRTLWLLALVFAATLLHIFLYGLYPGLYFPESCQTDRPIIIVVFSVLFIWLMFSMVDCYVVRSKRALKKRIWRGRRRRS